MPNTVSIDQVSHAKALPTSATLSHAGQTRKRLQANFAMDMCTYPSNRRTISSNPTVDERKYIVDSIVQKIVFR